MMTAEEIHKIAEEYVLKEHAPTWDKNNILPIGKQYIKKHFVKEVENIIRFLLTKYDLVKLNK